MISDLKSLMLFHHHSDQTSTIEDSEILDVILFCKEFTFPGSYYKNLTPGNMNRYELQERLINFSVLIVTLIESMPKTQAGGHFGRQLLRSGSSPALNYGESQSAESKKDFIHKLSIVLKELRESYVNLIIIKRTGCFNDETIISTAIDECNELIAIFVRSIQTAKR